MKTIKKVFDIIEKVCMEICVFLLSLIALAIFYQVIARKLGFSVTWVDEVTRYAFIFLVLIGTAAVSRRGTHIRISSFVDMLPMKIRRVTEALTYLLVVSMVFLFTYCCFFAAGKSSDVRFSILTFIKMRDFYYLCSGVSVITGLMVIVHVIEIVTGEISFPDYQGKDGKEA